MLGAGQGKETWKPKGRGCPGNLGRLPCSEGNRNNSSNNSSWLVHESIQGMAARQRRIPAPHHAHATCWFRYATMYLTEHAPTRVDSHLLTHTLTYCCRNQTVCILGLQQNHNLSQWSPFQGTSCRNFCGPPLSSPRLRSAASHRRPGRG